MRNISRVVLTLLMALCLFSLCACGSAPAAAPGEAAEEASSAPAFTEHGPLTFEENGLYTTGDEELDGYVAEILVQLMEDSPEDAGDRMLMLRHVYDYAMSNFHYVGRGSHFDGDGWEYVDAKTMLETGKGDCYNYAAGFTVLARGLGFPANVILSSLDSPENLHAWTDIVIDDTPYIFDPQMEKNFKDNRYMLTYKEGEKYGYLRPSDAPGEVYENSQDLVWTNSTERGELVASAEDEPFTVIREGEMEELIDAYLTENRINPDSIGIGFIYTETGEEWYYNGDEFFYSASLYKVPLLMLVSNKVARGELEQDAVIEGRTLTQMEEYILTVSNNTYAHILMNTFWPNNRDCRALWPALAGMELSDMPDTFVKTNLFSARYMSRVMNTLYSDPESYPMMIDFLKQATPGKFFRYQLEDQYEIAQKFGEYEEFRHVSGIIYTEHPIIVTYMTEGVRAHGQFSSDLAVRLVEYSKLLDHRWEEHEAELARREEEEAERLRAEQARAAAAAEEAERARAEAAAAAEAAQARLEAEAAAEESARQRTRLLYVGGGCTAAVAAVVFALRHRKHRRKGGESTT